MSVSALAIRLTCKTVGPRNHLGNEKLVGVLLEDGIQIWCKHCSKPYFVPRETCEAAWHQGIQVVVGCGHYIEE